MIRLLEFYQQAIKIQLLPPAADPAFGGASLPRKSSPPHQIHSMSRRMPGSPMSCSASSQSSILPGRGESLADIRRQLLGASPCPAGREVCPADHPSLIIEGTREERKASQALPQHPNESLSAVHFSFTETLDEGGPANDATSAARRWNGNWPPSIRPDHP